MVMEMRRIEWNGKEVSREKSVNLRDGSKTVTC